MMEIEVLLNPFCVSARDDPTRQTIVLSMQFPATLLFVENEEAPKVEMCIIIPVLVLLAKNESLLLAAVFFNGVLKRAASNTGGQIGVATFKISPESNCTCS